MAIVNDNTDAVFSQLEQQQDRFLLRVLEVGNQNIKRRTPYKTGNLQAHDLYEVTGPGEGRWFNDTDYGPSVFFGHTTQNGTHVAARPWIQQGLDDTDTEQEAERFFNG